jgi:DNA adenine methylase
MKPFIKWVGGKTQIIEDVLGSFPTKMKDYHEVFVGGGSVLLSVLSRELVTGKVCAYDLNGSLIALYQNIQSQPQAVYGHLKSLYEQYEKCEGSEVNRTAETLEEAVKSKENYYYWIRKRFNTEKEETPERSATFIFLNKMCFRGVYREGPNGFNVPYGHPKTTPVIISGEELTRVSKLIKKVQFRQCDFREAFKNMNNGDFVYLDPPYAPETKTSFVGYTKDGFGVKDHEELFELTKNSGVDFVMSNANVNMVTNSFVDYTIKELKARRAINSKNPESTTTEVLVSSSNQK